MPSEETNKKGIAIWPEIAVPALTLLFGLQMIRALLPYLVFLLGGRLGLPAFVYSGLALLLFATTFLVPRLCLQLGLSRLLGLSAGGVALSRLLVQLWRGDPLIDMLLVFIGVGLFLFFWPPYLALIQNQAPTHRSSYRLAQATLLGLALDTVLHGLFHTYDFIWQAGAVPLGLTLGLVLLQGLALRTLGAITPTEPVRVAGPAKAMVPWLAIGPFIFLELLIFQNQARLATLTDWNLPLVFAWVLSSHLLGLLVAALWQPRKVGAVLMGTLLLLTLWPFAGTGTLTIALALLLGQVALAVLISIIINRLAARQVTTSTGRLPGSAAYGFGMVGLVGLLFAYYVPFILPVSYDQNWILGLAGLLVGLGGILAANTSKAASHRPALLMMGLPWLLLLAPLFIFLTWRSSSPPTSPTNTIRLVDYNIQHGIGPDGQLDIEATVRVIQDQQPDIVTLQEVGRGWVINGSMDVVSWLSQRLDLPYVHYHPATDALWGQAVFSRFPILAADTQPLPSADLPLPRGFAYLQLDTGRPKPLQLLNTHLHHLPRDSDIRLQQTEAIVDFLALHPQERLIVTGDLNATSGTPEIQRLYESGLRDIVIEAGLSPGHTFNSIAPTKRLDYILISPDLTITGVLIPHSLASDHLPIVTTILIGP